MINLKKELELYIHIPFCIRKCEYCDFLSGSANQEQQKKYIEALNKEIQNCGSYDEYIVTTIFFGGGTPSILPGEWIASILEEIRNKFILSEKTEISIEANPGTVTREKLQQYRQAGMNRISFGCQSANNAELKMLGRIHTWENFLESFQMAREAGFSNINVDLMSGLPDQTLASWEESLKKIADLNPEHISAYSLIVEEGTPFAEKELNLPQEEEERLMYENTNQILGKYGYHQYEISNYAKPGYACRHNCGYWKRTEYLGLGLGSASLVRECRFSNTSDMKQYLECSSQTLKIRENIEYLSREEQIEETMFLGLRMLEGVSGKEFYHKYQRTLDDLYGEVLTKYIGMGMLEWRGERLCFTRAGISVSNRILSEFLLS